MSETFCGFTTVELSPGTRVFCRATERFKTAAFTIVLRRPLDEQTAAAALVPSLWRSGTASLPTRAAMARHLESLYGAGVGTGARKRGESQWIQLGLDAVAARFLPERFDTLEPGLEFLAEVLAKPRLVAGRFPAEVVARERENALRSVRGIYDDKGAWAFQRAVEEMCAGEAYARPEHGFEDEVAALDVETVTAAYRRLLATAPMEIYMVGAIEPQVMVERARAFAAFRNGASVVEPAEAQRGAQPVTLRRVQETEPVSQGKLVLGFRVERPTNERELMAQSLFANLFGGGPHSRLFREVREARSLCYSIGASLERDKGVLFVSGGLDAPAVEPALAVILQQLESVRRGAIAAGELATVKELIRNALRGYDESPQSLIGFCMESFGLGRNKTAEELMVQLETMTAEEVSAAAARVQPDLLYYLAPAEATS
jgi:predicted Zn-dependent peptidase